MPKPPPTRADFKSHDQQGERAHLPRSLGWLAPTLSLRSAAWPDGPRDRSSSPVVPFGGHGSLSPDTFRAWSIPSTEGMGLQRLRDFGHSWRALPGLIAVKGGANRETVTVSISRPPTAISLPGAAAARAHHRAS